VRGAALADELGGNTTAGTVGSGASRRFERRSGVIDHPDLGPVRTDSTVLTVPQGDLKLLVFTAEPGSADACKLAKLQTLSS
jgi:MmyB-like transcription regulator ligand binding domain